jgi:hypothetical protein
MPFEANHTSIGFTSGKSLGSNSEDSNKNQYISLLTP